MVENKEIDPMQAAWSLLGDKGLSFSERNNVKSAFAKWGRDHNPDIEHDATNKTYSNKTVPNYSFRTREEAIFIGDLKKFAPKVSNENLLKVMGIMMTLMGMDSEWKFEVKNG